MKRHKLELRRTTVQQLSASRAAEVRGGMNPGSDKCPTKSCITCNTDCCLLEPGTDV